VATPDSFASESWLSGSNCQRYAYGVLSLFGLWCPPLRSSDLWLDTTATSVVDSPQALDLALFNPTDEPYGAHVGVWMARDEILHLCDEIGTPVIWPIGEFASRPRYATLVGLKRVNRST